MENLQLSEGRRPRANQISLRKKNMQTPRRRRSIRLLLGTMAKYPFSRIPPHAQPPNACSICLDEFARKDIVRHLPCSHVYHAKCIDSWLMTKHQTCPSCQRNILDMHESHQNYLNTDCGGATRVQLIGFDRGEFGCGPATA